MYYFLECLHTVQRGEEATYHEQDEARIFTEQGMQIIYFLV
jgi:hypothetical protein